MKRFVITLFSILISIQTAFSSDVELLPTMSASTNIQDRAWCGAFQSAWNDLVDKVAFNEIRFADGTPAIARELNKREITSDDISYKKYYKYTGKNVKKAKAIIRKCISKKFNETSDSIDNLNVTSAKNYIIYTMFKNNIKYALAFDNLGEGIFRNKKAQYYGISSLSDNKLRQNVQVLFYDSPLSFAISTKTDKGDTVYLYKTQTTKPFNYIYQDMQKKQDFYAGNKTFGINDELKIPTLNFTSSKQFNELIEKRIKGTLLVLDDAIEEVKFSMSNEPSASKKKTHNNSEENVLDGTTDESPRYFYFDDTFVIFIKERDKEVPYFALRIYDIDNYNNI